jgi:Na+-translocating ferredoxin:NAD+ oxidoreductase subunit B
MENTEQVYRDLQRHLDKQPIGFPASKSGAEIRILKRLFTPEHARLATHLDYKLNTAEQVHERVRISETARGRATGATPSDTALSVAVQPGGLSLADVERMLDEMAAAGAIARVEKDGRTYFHTVPFVFGMYEYQAGRLSPEFLADAGAYFHDRAFGLSFLSTEVPQMRTIPVEKSVTVEHGVMSYDALVQLLEDSEGPFSVGECICRQTATMQGKPCKKTSRLETCMAVGGQASLFGDWRSVSREEALEIARLNQADGLVLQPSNTQKIDFVCACCGCCCGMLGVLKTLPKPVEFWATNFHATVDADLCSGCATCVDMCQMGAVALADGPGTSRIDLHRCIGCGNCVAACPAGAMRLVKIDHEVVPPVDMQDMYETIMAHKKGTLGKMKLAAKLMLKA